MNPFDDFGHFIAYFIPGIVLAVVLAMGLSCVIGGNLLTENGFAQNVTLALVLATILGLFIDELRHTQFEKYIEADWVDKNGYDGNKIEDFMTYAYKMGVNLYETIVEEYFYFYEFDTNLSVSLMLASFVLPIYFKLFYGLHDWLVVLALAVMIAMAFSFYYFGRECYWYFLSTMIDVMEKVAPGFKKSIAKNGYTNTGKKGSHASQPAAPSAASGKRRP